MSGIGGEKFAASHRLDRETGRQVRAPRREGARDGSAVSIRFAAPFASPRPDMRHDRRRVVIGHTRMLKHQDNQASCFLQAVTLGSER